MKPVADSLKKTTEWRNLQPDSLTHTHTHTHKERQRDRELKQNNKRGEIAADITEMKTIIRDYKNIICPHIGKLRITGKFLEKYNLLELNQ